MLPHPSVASHFLNLRQIDPAREYFERDHDDDKWWLRMCEWRRQKDNGNKISEDEVKNVVKDEKLVEKKAEVKGEMEVVPSAEEEYEVQFANLLHQLLEQMQKDENEEAWRQIKFPEIILSCEIRPVRSESAAGIKLLIRPGNGPAPT